MSTGKLKVIALGGCGGMGRYAVRTALGYDFVKDIAIADLDEKRGQAFAEKCGSKASFQQVDVNDQSALKDLFSEADVVLSTVGPYYRFGVPILKAAIGAGCHYIDINDDWEPTLEMLALDEEARKNGVTAIIGMGASPGVSNLLAVKAMEPLDTVEDLITGWALGDFEEEFDDPGEGGTSGAATEHWVHQVTGSIRVRCNGTFSDASPIENIKVNYPGLGKKTVYTVGHPEPVTLPLFRPEIKNSWNVMDFPPYIISILRTVAKKVDSGEMTVAEAAKWIDEFPALGLTGILFSRLGPRVVLAFLKQIFTPQPKYPSVFAIARGIRNNKKTTVGAHLNASLLGGAEKMTMGAATGVPLAVALKMLAQGRIAEHGVFTPEAAIDPDGFFDELAPLCTPAFDSVDQLVAVILRDTL